MTTDDHSFQEAGEDQRESCHSNDHPLPNSSSVYLGLGSNLGDREANLREAIARIEKLDLKIIRASSIYETEPIGYQDQPWFLNQVIEARMPSLLTFATDAEAARICKAIFETAVEAREAAAFFKSLFDKYPSLQAEALLHALLGIESLMGRERTIPNGPRVIDIDILLYGKAQVFFCKTRGAKDNPQIRIAESPLLVIPHPRMHERRFVLAPLCEIAPDLIPPGTRQTCCEMLAALNDPAIVRVYKSNREG